MLHIANKLILFLCLSGFLLSCQSTTRVTVTGYVVVKEVDKTFSEPLHRFRAQLCYKIKFMNPDHRSETNYPNCPTIETFDGTFQTQIYSRISQDFKGLPLELAAPPEFFLRTFLVDPVSEENSIEIMIPAQDSKISNAEMLCGTENVSEKFKSVKYSEIPLIVGHSKNKETCQLVANVQLSFEIAPEVVNMQDKKEEGYLWK